MAGDPWLMEGERAGTSRGDACLPVTPVAQELKEEKFGDKFGNQKSG